MSLISEALILWYNRHHRDLPWRHTRDPYLIWVSEIILQQTQVVTGIGYYHRIVERFPTVSDMADTSEDELLKMWQGLGYYSRARNMLAAACFIKDNYNGVFPSEYSTILSLKGVGKYTAAAIASFAFDMPYPVVDGNVARVLSRLSAMSLPIDSNEGKKELERLAYEILDPFHAALHNQSIMELGALVCRPANPLCHECPLIIWCEAKRRENVSDFPVKSKKIAIRQRYLVFMCVEIDNHILIERREEDDIWKGLYQFPLIELEHPLKKDFSGHDLSMIIDVDDRCLSVVDITEVRHVLTHQRLHLYFMKVIGNRDLMNEHYFRKYQSVRIEDLSMFAFPKPIVSYLNELK